MHSRALFPSPLHRGQINSEAIDVYSIVVKNSTYSYFPVAIRAVEMNRTNMSDSGCILWRPWPVGPGLRIQRSPGITPCSTWCNAAVARGQPPCNIGSVRTGIMRQCMARLQARRPCCPQNVQSIRTRACHESKFLSDMHHVRRHVRNNARLLARSTNISHYKQWLALNRRACNSGVSVWP